MGTQNEFYKVHYFTFVNTCNYCDTKIHNTQMLSVDSPDSHRNQSEHPSNPDIVGIWRYDHSMVATLEQYWPSDIPTKMISKEEYCNFPYFLNQLPCLVFFCINFFSFGRGGRGVVLVLFKGG